MDETPHASSSRANTPQRIGAALIGLLQGHIELFGEELKDLHKHSLQLLVLTSCCVVFALLLVLGLSAALLIYYWDSYRLTVIFSLCGFYACALLASVLVLTSRIRNASAPFSASLEELACDREQLLP